MKLFFSLIVALISTLCHGVRGWYLRCTILAHEEGALWKFSTWLIPLWELFTRSPRIQCGQIGSIIQQDLWNDHHRPILRGPKSFLLSGSTVSWTIAWPSVSPHFDRVGRGWGMLWWHLASPGVRATSSLWLKCLGSSLSPWPSHSSTWPSVTVGKDRMMHHCFNPWVTKSENRSGLEAERGLAFYSSSGFPAVFLLVAIYVFPLGHLAFPSPPCGSGLV